MAVVAARRQHLTRDGDDGAAPSRRAGRSRSYAGLAALVLVFLVAATALRVPTFSNHVFNSDEAYLATEAQILNDGGRLYHDVVDRKPPLVPYLYAAAFRVVGSDDLVSVRVLAVLAHVSTALLLVAEARRRFGSRHASVAVGLLYLLAATAMRPQDAQAANFEVFMLPLMTAALVLGARNRTTASGVVLAAATLAKQTAALTLLPLAWLAWSARRGRGVAALAITFALPLVAVAALFGVRDFFFWVFLGHGSYLDVSGALGYALGRGVRGTAWFLFGGAALVVLAGLGARRWRDDADLWLWLLSGALAAVLGLRFFGHYYLQMLPPLVLLAGRSLASPQFLGRPWRIAAVAVLAAVPAAYHLAGAWSAGPDRNLRTALAVAAHVRERTEPGDRVLVWGQAPEVYWASGRRPATRFPTAAFVTGASGGRPPDRVGPRYATRGALEHFLADLRARPPSVIADMSTADHRNAGRYPPASVPSFQHFLDEGGWHEVTTVAGVAILRRR